MTEPLLILYLNHRGDITVRRIRPLGVFWGHSDFHLGTAAWYMLADDLDKGVERTFKMVDILAIGEAAINLQLKVIKALKEKGL